MLIFVAGSSANMIKHFAYRSNYTKASEYFEENEKVFKLLADELIRVNSRNSLWDVEAESEFPIILRTPLIDSLAYQLQVSKISTARSYNGDVNVLFTMHLYSHNIRSFQYCYNKKYLIQFSNDQGNNVTAIRTNWGIHTGPSDTDFWK